MPTYTFRLPARFASTPVTVYNTADVQQTTGTTDSNALFVASLPTGDYYAKISYGYTSYRAAGEVDRGDPDGISDANFVAPGGKTTTGTAAPLVTFNVLDYGAVGNDTADDTAAIQAAADAAAAAGGVLLFPRGHTYKITDAITLTVKNGLTVMGGSGRTKIRQATANKHGFKLARDAGSDFTYITDLAIENLRIIGPGGATTGVGIWTDPAAATYAGNNLMLRNVLVESFDVGVYLYKFDNIHAHSLLIKTCRVGWFSDGNANDIHLTNCGASTCTETGYDFGAGGGVTFRPGDLISCGRAIRLRGSAQVTVMGGDFESSTGTEFVLVEANGMLTHIGGQFTKNIGGDVTRYSVTGRALVIGPYEGGFTTATMTKTATTALAYLLGGPERSLSTGATSGILDAGTGALIRGSVFDTRIDNSVPAAIAALRGDMLWAIGRDGANAQDRLITYIRERDGSTYTARDLIGPEPLHSTSGTSHARVQSIRSFVGRVNFTTAAATFTDVTVTTSTTASIYSATATVSIENLGLTGPLSVVLKTTTGTTVVFRVYHAADTAGGSALKLHYRIDAAF